MKCTLFAVLMALLLTTVIGCKSGVEEMSAPSKTKAAVVEQAIPTDFKLEFSREMCYRFCPVYSLIVNVDGTVVYNGEHFVKVIGKRSWKLDNEALEKLVSAIKASDYFSIPDIYSKDAGCKGFALHESYVDIAINMKSSVNKLKYYYGCGFEKGSVEEKHIKAIELLATNIDEICGIEKVIGTDEERKNTKW